LASIPVVAPQGAEQKRGMSWGLPSPGVNALLFYTNVASVSASGPNACQQRVISCKR
jgi:hypothetical protein